MFNKEKMGAAASWPEAYCSVVTWCKSQEGFGVLWDYGKLGTLQKLCPELRL